MDDGGIGACPIVTGRVGALAALNEKLDDWAPDCSLHISAVQKFFFVFTNGPFVSARAG